MDTFALLATALSHHPASEFHAPTGIMLAARGVALLPIGVMGEHDLHGTLFLGGETCSPDEMMGV